MYIPAHRQGSNEWFVAAFVPKGIMLFALHRFFGLWRAFIFICLVSVLFHPVLGKSIAHSPHIGPAEGPVIDIAHSFRNLAYTKMQ